MSLCVSAEGHRAGCGETARVEYRRRRYGRKPGSPVFWQERIQAGIQIEGDPSYICCWDEPRSITQRFIAWLHDEGVQYPASAGWDLRGVVTYRRDGEDTDRTVYGATVTQLVP